MMWWAFSFRRRSNGTISVCWWYFIVSPSQKLPGLCSSVRSPRLGMRLDQWQPLRTHAQVPEISLDRCLPRPNKLLLSALLKLIRWELISWEVDLMGVDLVGVDPTGVDLVGWTLASHVLNQRCYKLSQRCYNWFITPLINQSDCSIALKYSINLYNVSMVTING